MHINGKLIDRKKAYGTKNSVKKDLQNGKFTVIDELNIKRQLLNFFPYIYIYRPIANRKEN